MRNKLDDLLELKIDRNVKSRGRSVLLILSFLFIMGLAIGCWVFFFRPAAIPIVAYTVGQQEITRHDMQLDSSGYVVARRQATLSAQIIGKVIYLNAEEGQLIHQNDIIARVDDSNYSAVLLQAQAQERQAQIALEDATSIYRRYEALKTQNAISTDAFENERALYDTALASLGVARAAVAVAKSNEDYTTVRAPFDGVVTDKVAQVGEIVSPAAAGGGDTRTGIATIVDMNSLEVEVEVSENYIDRVYSGEKVVVQLNAYPTWNIPGSVIAIIPTADQSKGTVKVRIGLEAKDQRILPQMAARVSFDGAKSIVRNNALMVPHAAVLSNGTIGTIFIIRDNRIEEREVKLGSSTLQAVSVLSGIKEGDRLASGNLRLLHNGTLVKIVN